jgi:hypothetical protein
LVTAALCYDLIRVSIVMVVTERLMVGSTVDD